MSINSNMRTYVLEEDMPTVSSTGAKSSTWKKIEDIQASLFQTSSTLNTQNVQYNSSSHVGYTYFKGLVAGKHRLLNNGNIYDILSVDDTERMSILLLKAVDFNGR